MTRAISLAHLTVLDMAPPRMIRAAADIGYDSVGLRLIAVTDTTPGYALMSDPALMRETKAALADTGLTVLDIEFVKIVPGFDASSLDAFLEAGAELGARHVITAPYDPDLGALSENLARFGERSAAFGLQTVLEFFPWTVVPDLRSAVGIVEATNRDDIGILVDTLHFDRSGSRLDDFLNVPPARFPFAHVCDAMRQPSYTTEELLYAGRAERLPPGDGEIDIRSILHALPEDIPLALEVPMVSIGNSILAARAAFMATKRLLNEAPERESGR